MTWGRFKQLIDEAGVEDSEAVEEITVRLPDSPYEVFTVRRDEQGLVTITQD